MSDLNDTVTSQMSKDVAWWIPSIHDRITPEIRQTFETYSQIPPDEIETHVYEIREEAWSLQPWPCIGMGLFLQPTLSIHPHYNDLVDSLRKGGNLLDIGCFIGTDLRRLFFDGIPASQLYGTDLVNYWDIGFELFRDKDKSFGLQTKFAQDDLLEFKDGLRGLVGQMDVVTGFLLLHNWDWAKQTQGCMQIVSLLKSKPGSKFVGAQVGTYSKDPSMWISGNDSKDIKPQSAESFKQMWIQVGEKTLTLWEVETSMKSWEEYGVGASAASYMGEEKGLLEFVVTRKK